MTGIIVAAGRTRPLLAGPASGPPWIRVVADGSIADIRWPLQAIYTRVMKGIPTSRDACRRPADHPRSGLGRRIALFATLLLTLSVLLDGGLATAGATGRTSEVAPASSPSPGPTSGPGDIAIGEGGGDDQSDGDQRDGDQIGEAASDLEARARELAAPRLRAAKDAVGLLLV